MNLEEIKKRNDIMFPSQDINWLIAEVEALREWVNDLQSEMYINCVYCGHRYGPNPGTPIAMADVLREHIEKCPKHPLSHMKARAEKAEARIERLEATEAQQRYLAEQNLIRARKAEADNRRLTERARELERDISILRGLSQKERIYRGSFAQYATETVETSDVTKRALTPPTEQGEGMTIKEKEAWEHETIRANNAEERVQVLEGALADTICQIEYLHAKFPKMDDYRYSEEAREIDLKIVWRCDKCGQEREDYPGCNEGGVHDGCGGEWCYDGESYLG